MTSRERILTILKGGVPDRVGKQDSLWGETVSLWKEQGHIQEGEDLNEHFGFDMSAVSGMDIGFGFTPEIIEDTDEYIIQRDGNGVLRKDFKRESGHTPLWLEHKLSCGKDWWEYKDRLTPTDNRVAADAVEASKKLKEKGQFSFLVSLEPYEAAWPVFGQVNIFTMMMDEPEAVGDIFNTYADLIIALAQKSLDIGIDYDGAWFYGDVGYRNSTLFSPEIYDELLFPAHKKICDFFNSYGKPVILHSCGKIESLIPKFIEAGFSAIQPLEAKCGQDVRVLKELYGKKITFFGNIDVRKLSGTKQEIEEEIKSKLAVVAKDGGYIFHSDHSVPPTVSYDNYMYALEMLEKYGKY